MVALGSMPRAKIADVNKDQSSWLLILKVALGDGRSQANVLW